MFLIFQIKRKNGNHRWYEAAGKCHDHINEELKKVCDEFIADEEYFDKQNRIDNDSE